MTGDMEPLPRGDALYYRSASGIPVADIIDPAYLFVQDRFASTDGPEWDTFDTTVAIPAGATYASFQIESPADRRGDSGFWVNAILELPLLTGSIGDFVWKDFDGGGDQDPEEPGIGGVVLRLYDCQDDLLAVDTTDVAGYYLFDDLLAGCYRVDVEDGTLPEGYDLTPPPEPREVQLGEGEDRLDVDFGYQPPPSFVIEVKKVFAWPGQQHIKVPVFLSNPVLVGGWEILMEYDNSIGTVIGVEVCDSARVDDSTHGGPNKWYYAPWFYDSDVRPEYFNFQLNADGHPNMVRIIGIQNLDWPQVVTPPLPPGQQQLLFCLIFDLSPNWGGHNVIFGFHTADCTDNTVTDAGGTTLWGPDTLSAPLWTCPQRSGRLRAIQLSGGHGIGIQNVDIGDINCDGVPYSVADAMMFIGYLTNGPDALRDDDGEFYCGSFDAHCCAGDIDHDGFCFTISDLVALIRIINDAPKVSIASDSGDNTVTIFFSETTSEMTEVMVSSPVEIGAALFVIGHDGQIGPPKLAQLGVGMTMTLREEDGMLKVLIYSLGTRTIGAGWGSLLAIPGGDSIVIEEVSLVDAFGRPLKVELGSLPSTYRLAQNHPNPFNAATVISYTVPEGNGGEIAVLRVYNIAGQVVRTLVNDHREPGRHQVLWDGRDEQSQEVASGVYLFRLQAGEYDAARKSILIR